MAETSHLWDDFALAWTRGREYRLDLTVTATPHGGSEGAQNLTGGTIYVTGKRWLSDADADAIFRLNTDDLGGVSVLSASAGTARATIPASATADLPDEATPIYVDCVWVDSSGKPYSFQKGTITFYGSAELLTA